MGLDLGGGLKTRGMLQTVFISGLKGAIPNFCSSVVQSLNYETAQTVLFWDIL